MRNFLGPTSQGTVIIIKKVEGHPSPDLKRAREIFDVKSLCLYQSKGWYWEEISRIQQLLQNLSIFRGNNPDYSEFTSDYYFYSDQFLAANSFFLAAYAPVTLAALCLTDQCMTDLKKLVYLHYQITNERDSVDEFIRRISRTATSSTTKTINDPTMSNPNVEGLRNLLDGYGDIAYKSICDRLDGWRIAYTWK